MPLEHLNNHESLKILSKHGYLNTVSPSSIIGLMYAKNFIYFYGSLVLLTKLLKVLQNEVEASNLGWGDSV